MQTSTSRPRLNKTRWLAAGLTLLVLFAIGVTTVFGAAAGLLASRLTPKTAQLQDLRGWVEVQEGGAWRPARSGETVTAGQRVRTGSLSSADLVFYDGSQASLSANAELSVDQLYAPKVRQRTIVLTQWTGESDHHVAPNKTEGSRYAVNTAAGTGEAKGTVFHVAVSSDQSARYAVTEGTVAVSGMDSTVLVDAGEITTLSGEQPPLEPALIITGEGLVSQVGDVWIIAGQDFVVSAETTITGSPQVNDWVSVQGHLAADGTKVADSIALRYTSPTNQFTIIGTVDAIGDTAWTINGQAVTLTPETQGDAGIVVGDTVRAEGLVLSDGTFQATSIRRIDAAAGQPFDFVGVVQEIAVDKWLISGMPVTVSAETIFDENLQAGELVQVTGLILPDGAWQAASITRLAEAAHPFDFTGILESLDPWKVGGITLQTGDFTQIAPDLKAGDQVRVVGETDANGVWMAAKIELVVEAEAPQMIVVGPVTSLDPLTVNDIQFTADGTTVLPADLQVGMLVKVTAEQQPDETWLIVEVQAMELPSWVPECMQVTAAVTSFDGSQIQVEGLPLAALDENAVVEGEVTAGATVAVQVCFDANLDLHVTQITVVQDTEEDPDEDTGEEDTDEEDQDDGDQAAEEHKVDVCHKPDKKGGHTINIDESALPAHLAHGDTEGPCK